MKRGGLATAVLQGEHGKPRPVLIVQADNVARSELVSVLLLNSDLANASALRPIVLLTKENGLRKISQVMIDRLFSVHPKKMGPVFGRLDENTMREVDHSLAMHLGLLDESGNLNLRRPIIHRKTDF